MMIVWFSTAEGADYVFANGFSVTFPPSATPAPQTLAVSIIDDTVIESDHSFNVEISSTSDARVAIGSPSSVVVSIIDNDGTFVCSCMHGVDILVFLLWHDQRVLMLLYIFS